MLFLWCSLVKIYCAFIVFILPENRSYPAVPSVLVVRNLLHHLSCHVVLFCLGVQVVLQKSRTKRKNKYYIQQHFSVFLSLASDYNLFPSSRKNPKTGKKEHTYQTKKHTSIKAFLQIININNNISFLICIQRRTCPHNLSFG